MAAPRRGVATSVRVLMALLLSLAACATLQAATVTVGPGGPPTYDYATIQAGIDNATSGDTVQVAAGTYNENLTWNTKDLQLMGAGRA